MTLYNYLRGMLGGDHVATRTVMNAWMRTDWHALTTATAYLALATLGGVYAGR
jgi:hypothetical protein